MDLNLTEEQDMIVRMVRRFVRDEIIPLEMHLDPDADELAPEDFRWIYLLAVVREINGADAEEMIELFRRAAALRPDYAPIYIRLGDGLWRRGRHDEAEDELQKAIRLAPNAALAYRRLGQVALTRSDFVRTVQKMNRSAVTPFPLNVALCLENSQALCYSGMAHSQIQGGLAKTRHLTCPIDLLPQIHQKLFLFLGEF